MTEPMGVGPFAGALRIARYNWPFYASAAVVVVLGACVAVQPSWPAGVRVAAALAALVAGWFALGSFLASHWVFDRSPLTRWQWLAGTLPRPPSRWVHVNAGLRETSAPLGDIFPGAEGRVLDIFDPEAMTEPAIARARRTTEEIPSERARCDALPVGDGWADAVFLLLTAHEIRKAQERDRFFTEVARILAPGGRVVLVEHLRDAWNAMAFGPGFFHFFSRREWLRTATRARLRVEGERRMTPFVRVFVLGKSDGARP